MAEGTATPVLERGTLPADDIQRFFETLCSRGVISELRGAHGIARFAIEGAGTWRLSLVEGTVALLGPDGPTNCTLTTTAPVFLRAIRGESRPITAVFRDEMRLEGDIALMVYFQRVFPVARHEGHIIPVPEHPDGRPAAPMTEETAKTKAQPEQVMPSKSVSILEGNNFVVSDARGDIDATPTDTQGLFAYDTRYLSRWILTIDGVRPQVLTTEDLRYFAVQFFLVAGTGTVYVDSTLSMIRKRAVGGGFHEELTIFNHAEHSVTLTVRVEAAADFADLFEIKDALPKQGQYYQRIEEGHLVLGYQREHFVRETWIVVTAPEARFDEHGVTFHLELGPHGTWTTDLDVITAKIWGAREVRRSVKYHHVDDKARPDMGHDLDEWLAAAPRLVSDNAALERIYRKSLIDLAALRFYSQSLPGDAIPAAGLPWFMTLFGRDSLFTSFQALPFTAELAEATLRQLALLQGSHCDDFRDEEPGKILHELRYGEMAAFEERPHSPYYGAADATQLFLILLDEYERWTGNTQLVRELELSARAALRWIDEYGDRNHDGFIEYERRNAETGLENQCWKDSWNSILFADGTLSKLPRATCELQGYAYDAKIRCARLARRVWNDPALADQLEREAADLKRRFNEAFWLPDRQYFALAIDGDGRKVDSLTSNIGHLLWSGIVEDDKIEACVRHLMGPRLFSGWGVRTMAEGDRGYNPVGYHVGTVWPFDCSIIAWGLTRYGYRTEAARIAEGILSAAPHFHDRLPEAFAGYPRSLTQCPVEYPTACSPQAWSTGAPFLLLRAVLGLQPIDGKLLVDPALPTVFGRIELLDISGSWGHVDAFGRGRIEVDSPKLY